MRRLTVFNQVSIDGYFTDRNNDMSWAHRQDAEWEAFGAENAMGEGALVFGRKTYELMAGFWPTPEGRKANPDVADGMARMRKIVFSRTLSKPAWENTTVIRDDIIAAMRTLKSEPGPDLVIMGSGTLVTQFTDARLIDEYQVVVCPIVLGAGRTMFEGVKARLNLTVTRTRPFKNGNVVVWYEPAA